MSPSFPLVVVCSLWLAARARSQNLSLYSLPSLQFDDERRQLSTSSRNGDVFVGAGGTLYRLSSELQQLQNVSVPGRVVALTTTADGDYLVACFTNRRCAAYNTTTLNNDVASRFAEGSADSLLVASSAFENESLINADHGYFPNYTALFTSPISKQLTFFIGFADGEMHHFLQRGFATASSDNSIDDNALPFNSEIIGGFVYNTSVYFIELLYAPCFCFYVYSGKLPIDDGYRSRRTMCCGATLRSDLIASVSEVDGTMVVSKHGQVCSYNLDMMVAKGIVPEKILINKGVTISLTINVESNLFLFVVTEKNTSLNIEKVRKVQITMIHSCMYTIGELFID